ncbi:hypothetical protein AAHC03_013970 [Spirometra sp. Aus1]
MERPSPQRTDKTPPTPLSSKSDKNIGNRNAASNELDVKRRPLLRRNSGQCRSTAKPLDQNEAAKCIQRGWREYRSHRNASISPVQSIDTESGEGDDEEVSDLPILSFQRVFSS